MTEPMRRATFGDPCVACGRPSNHLSGNRPLCCACHYAESGVAADWHPDCLAAMARAGKNPPPLATPPHAMTDEPTLSPESEAHLNRAFYEAALHDGITTYRNGLRRHISALEQRIAALEADKLTPEEAKWIRNGFALSPGSPKFIVQCAAKLERIAESHTLPET